jgi:hypothetical protein
VCQNGSLSIRETEKLQVQVRGVGWVGDNSHVVFGKKKFPGEKVSARLCVVMMQQPVLLLPKFGVKSTHFQSPYNITVVCGIDCLACQEEFFVNNHTDVKKK